MMVCRGVRRDVFLGPVSWRLPRRSAHSLRHQQRRLRALGEDSENIDIDKLAQQLTHAATSRRKEEVSVTLPEDVFDVEDFEVVQTLGFLSVKSANSRDGPPIARSAAVVAYVGRYFSGKSRQYPVLTYLKEFLPVAKSAALNEFCIMQKLCPPPKDPWEVAAVDAEKSQDIPVVQFLGCFRGRPVRPPLQSAIAKPLEHSLWFVYKWEAMKPLCAYFITEQKPPSMIWPWAHSKQKEKEARYEMIHAICRGLLNAVHFCHSKGVAHGSLGTGSILLSTFDDYSADDVIVKLDNFGFASEIYQSNQDTVCGELRKDIKALGLLFLEIVILSLAKCEGADSCNPSSIERLALEIFRDDFQSLQEYCRNEPDWQAAVAFLDQEKKYAWDIIEQLLEGNLTTTECIKHPFFT